MNKLNVARGMLASKKYIRGLEENIAPIYENTEVKSNDELCDLQEFQDEFVADISNRIGIQKIQKTDEITKKEAYQTLMNSDSRRIRPLLMFLGNLCGSKKTDRKILINCGLSIEMIHKMSLILDDYFDGDLTRRGNPAFHTIYNRQVIIDATNLLLNLSNSTFLNGISDLPINQQENLLELYKKIIFDMGKGFIEDLDRTDKSLDLENAYRINDLQSTTVLQNSLLIGYLLSSRISKKDDTYSGLESIGATIGRTFQGLNDIENFLSEETQVNNKGNLYSDLREHRKNIILSQVPKELFYPPFTNADVIEYIKSNNLIDTTTEELMSGIIIAKKEIVQLSNPIARDTLLFATDKVTEKTLKKIMNNR